MKCLNICELCWYFTAAGVLNDPEQFSCRNLDEGDLFSNIN